VTILFQVDDRQVAALQAELARLKMELVAAEDAIAALRTENHEVHTRVGRLLAENRALKDENSTLRRTLEGGNVNGTNEGVRR
jgi:regulator of replication initiation timing